MVINTWNYSLLPDC